jgi:protein-S-isoprenylcysteine O-methyltransferase Ste14
MSKIEKAITGNKQEPKAEGHTSDDDRQLKPPTLAAWLAALATVGTIVLAQFLSRGDNAYLRGAGLLLLALAAVLIFTPLFLLRKHGRIEAGETYMETRTVVDRGCYSFIRHPQYLGYMFLSCGFAFLSQHWLVMVLAAAGIAAFYYQAVEEESYCLVRLGEAYRRYMQRVPRFNFILGAFRVLSRATQEA